MQSTELKAEVDVRTNFDRYLLARQQLAKYQGNAIELARKVLEAKLTSYRLGYTTLLDVLQAEKDETGVRLNYITALTERANALVALEQSAGFWDISNSLWITRPTRAAQICGQVQSGTSSDQLQQNQSKHRRDANCQDGDDFVKQMAAMALLRLVFR